VRRALDYLRKEAEKAQERGGRLKEGTNTTRAVGVLSDAQISLELFRGEPGALSALALLLQPGIHEALQASVVRLLASAAAQGPADRKASAELQSLLGIANRAIANLLEIVQRCSPGDGLQVDAFALVTELIRDNEDAQAEAFRCDVVALIDRKMATSEDPRGQVAAAGCAAIISTPQGLGLMVRGDLSRVRAY
jgi:hypothetical protein